MHGSTCGPSRRSCLALGAVAHFGAGRPGCAPGIAIGPQYEAGGLHRWLWGDGLPGAVDEADRGRGPRPRAASGAA